MGCCAFLQGTFPTQGLNLCLLCLHALEGGFFVVVVCLFLPLVPSGIPFGVWCLFNTQYCLGCFNTSATSEAVDFWALVTLGCRSLVTG